MNDRPLGSRYVLGERMGSGGMGDVFRARTLEGDEVAVKILRSQLTEDRELVPRFVGERTAMLAVRSPHVVKVLDMVVEGSTLAIVMELVRGRDLAVVRRTVGTLPAGEVARLGGAIARGMQAVHAAGIVHRDLKPANILLDETVSPPRPAVADFGVARICEDGEDNSLTVQAGTSAYMSPEQIRGRGITPASDVYSLGVLLYEVLCGTVPFRGGVLDVMRMHQEMAPGRPEGLHDGLWHLLDAMMAKDPARRPTMAETEAELTRLLPALAPVPALRPLTAPPAPVPLAAVGPDADATRVRDDEAAAAARAAAAAAGAGTAGGGALGATGPTAPLPPEPPTGRRGRWKLVAAALVVVVALVGIGGGYAYLRLTSDGDAAFASGSASEGTTDPESSEAGTEPVAETAATSAEETSEAAQAATTSASPSAEEVATMPDLVGQNEARARQALPDDVEVVVEEELTEDGTQAGRVQSTVPEAGEAIGDEVTLTVARAQSSMPLSAAAQIDLADWGKEGDFETVTMNGTPYGDSLVIENRYYSDDSPEAAFNLARRFDTFTFTLGRADTDPSGQDARTVEIYLDDVKYDAYAVPDLGKTLDVSIPVEDVLRLKIVVVSESDDVSFTLGKATLFGSRENIEKARQEAEGS
ncbi:protein kinase domain-containing protein [Brachybacterium sp. DNPG3]